MGDMGVYLYGDVEDGADAGAKDIPKNIMDTRSAGYSVDASHAVRSAQRIRRLCL